MTGRGKGGRGGVVFRFLCIIYFIYLLLFGMVLAWVRKSRLFKRGEGLVGDGGDGDEDEDHFAFLSFIHSFITLYIFIYIYHNPVPNLAQLCPSLPFSMTIYPSIQPTNQSVVTHSSFIYYFILLLI